MALADADRFGGHFARSGVIGFGGVRRMPLWKKEPNRLMLTGVQRKPLLFALALVASAAAPGAAQACRAAVSQTPILHERLPRPLPRGTVAAEVEVVTDVRAPGNNLYRMDVRIVRMILGDYAGRTIRVEPALFSGCDGWPYPGMRGILVGRVLSSSAEALVIDPIRAPSAAELHRAAGRGPAKGGLRLSPE